MVADQERLREVNTKIRAITDRNQQYLAHADVSRAIASVPGSASVALAHPLFDANLTPASLRASLPTSFSMLTDTAVRIRYNDNFVVHELQKLDVFFSNLVDRKMAGWGTDGAASMDLEGRGHFK